jgi:large subunit ribosomal protein L18
MYRERKKLREKRKKRIRGKVFGTKNVPRICIYKSNRHLYLQAIDDGKGKTLLFAADTEIKKKGGKNLKILEKLALQLSKKAKKEKIKKIVFDRSGYPYKGKVKQLAKILRKEGLKF